MNALSVTMSPCNICYHYPKDECAPNIGPVAYWDPDDGYVIAPLCPGCYDDCADARPDPKDFAYQEWNEHPDDHMFSVAVETDEDTLDAFNSLVHRTNRSS